jgi:tRNA (uracil-5-)-methyltransferase
MYILRQLYRPILLSTLKPITLVKMSTSPPSKKARTEDFEMLPVEDAPVNNLFVPEATASTSASTAKPDVPKGKKKNRRIKRTLPELYSPADVTFRDVRDFLGAEYVDAVLARGDESEWNPPALELWSVVELKVGAFTVSGTPLLHFITFCADLR